MAVKKKFLLKNVSWIRPLIIIFLCQLRLDPELMERVYMNVWHQRWTANHNTEQVWHHRQTANHNTEPARFKSLLLKVKRLKNEEFKHISTEVLLHERWQIKEIILLYQWNLWS